MKCAAHQIIQKARCILLTTFYTPTVHNGLFYSVLFDAVSKRVVHITAAIIITLTVRAYLSPAFYFALGEQRHTEQTPMSISDL